jgi:hypothetical protein
MCYRCDECGESTQQRQKMLKKTIFRAVRYPNGTQGIQIAHETRLCRVCKEETDQDRPA